MRKAVRFFRLPLADQCFVMRVLFLVSVVRFALRIMGFSKVRHLLLRFHKSPLAHNPEPAAVQRIIHYVDVVSNVVLTQRPCLTRALVAQVLLARCNFPTNLRLGVARHANGRIEAHAWLEHNGHIVIGDLPDLQRFTPMPELEKNAL